MHEWLYSLAGSEQTFLAMADALPTADLYALSKNPDVVFDVGGREIKTTALNRVAARRGGTAALLPLMPAAWRAVRSESYDIVVTSSHAFCRAFPPARTALHLSYTHTPMRYVWLTEIDSRSGGARIPAVVLQQFQALDRHYARTVDSFAANSITTEGRIKEFYQRSAVVIPPPVDTDYFTPDAAVSRDYLLSASRFVPYKRHDLAIHAAAMLNERLIIAGRGDDEVRLRQIADDIYPDGVEFVIDPDNRSLRELFRGARALVFGAFEDFGIVPVEAQACGTPVVALDTGGTAESVVDGVTGRLVQEQTAEAFARGVADVLDSRPSPAACRKNAERYTRTRFQQDTVAWIIGEVRANELGQPRSTSG